MILGVLIGNTNIKIGYLVDNRLISHTYKNDCYDFSDIKHLPVKKILLASVVPNLIVPVCDFLKMLFGMAADIIRKEDVPINLEKYDTSNIGIDRILSCYGAFNLATAFAVFDLGTAISVSVVDQDKNFLGGAIMPGIEMGLSALGAGTALLPSLDIATMTTAPVIGSDTKSGLESGAIHGTAAIIEGMANRIEKTLGQRVQIVLTGGFAPYVLDQLDIDFLHQPNLTIEGLLGTCKNPHYDCQCYR